MCGGGAYILFKERKRHENPRQFLVKNIYIYYILKESRCSLSCFKEKAMSVPSEDC